MNILIGPKTGNITGIINWAESRILPFGFALCGLKNILGYIDSTGWHYYDNRHELEGLLWQEFFKKVHNASEVDMRLIRHARFPRFNKDSAPCARACEEKEKCQARPGLSMWDFVYTAME